MTRQIRFTKCDENRGMLLIVEKYSQLREDREPLMEEGKGRLANIVDT